MQEMECQQRRNKKRREKRNKENGFEGKRNVCLFHQHKNNEVEQVEKEWNNQMKHQNNQTTKNFSDDIFLLKQDGMK